MSYMYFKKPNGSISHCNLKIFNDDGIELSLQGDDSCGAMKESSRITAALFAGENLADMLGDEIFGPSAEDFLHILAKHLGYTVEKITC
jgi:hypothetical protein